MLFVQTHDSMICCVGWDYRPEYLTLQSNNSKSLPDTCDATDERTRQTVEVLAKPDNLASDPPHDGTARAKEECGLKAFH